MHRTSVRRFAVILIRIVTIITSSAWSFPILPNHQQHRQRQPYRKRITTTTSTLSSSSNSNSNTFDQNQTTTTIRVSDLQWNRMIQRLTEFYQTHGHTAVSKKHNEPELYQWTKSIRNNYRHCQHRLSSRKRTALQALEFPWDLQNKIWEQRYQQLLRFRQTHGHARVPPNDRNFPGLGVWVRNQRREYLRLQRGLPSTLNQQRLQLLQQVHFEWYRSHQQAWDHNYRQLEEFQQKYGHANVPENYVHNPSLGVWCMNQRTAYRKYRSGEPTAITIKRIKKLEQLEFCWNYREHVWMSRLERLKRYHQTHGHVNIATNDEENRDLRIWLILQRYYYHRWKQEGTSSPMTEQRVRAMEQAVPNFSWRGRNTADGPSTKDWAKLFDAMRAKGLQPGMRPKSHWFEGMNPFDFQIKNTWTEKDLLELWNQAEEDEGEDD